MQKLKLGTRRSLLAWAQSSWVAREVERLNPGVEVELVGIDTRGDKILDVSLQSVAGKEFFVAELDEALREGRVDFTVHSMKDLSLDRPHDFVSAAIPKRANPRDVVLYGPGVMDKIGAGKKLRIGTSSPRRQENIPGFLRQALPVVNGCMPVADLVEIRGNVNTRLSRVHEPAESDRALDGVVLAFAGLIRLWADEAGRAELSKLLNGVRWMVLPLRESPAAPAQGALAVECRGADARVREILGRLHHADTAARVSLERQLLADWGGGCHQKFGATAVSWDGATSADAKSGALLYIRGRKPDGEFVEELRWRSPAAKSVGAVWDGSKMRGENATVILPSSGAGLEGRAVFVAHARAVTKAAAVAGSRVWTSGTPSWYKLAQQGIWVEGCAEGLGFASLESTLSEAVLQLPAFENKNWAVLTHEDGHQGWERAEVIATYRVDKSRADEVGDLAAARHVYWSSGSQFDQFADQVLKGATHACGPGKTAKHLREQGVEPVVFPSAEEWRKWLQIKI